MQIAADILQPFLQRGDEAHQLFDRLKVGLLPFFGASQFGIPQNPGAGVAAGPGNDCGGAGAEKIDPVERVVFLVETDDAALDQILADIAAIQVHVEAGFQLAGMTTSTGKFALATVREEFLVHGQKFHQAARQHSASVSKLVRRATRSRFGMFDPRPLSKMIFLNPWWASERVMSST